MNVPFGAQLFVFFVAITFGIWVFRLIVRIVLKFAKSLRARGRLNSWVARKIFPEKLLENPEKYLFSASILKPMPLFNRKSDIRALKILLIIMATLWILVMIGVALIYILGY